MRIALSTTCVQAADLFSSFLHIMATYVYKVQVHLCSYSLLRKQNFFGLLSIITAVIFSVGLSMSLSLVQTTCQKSHIDILDGFLHLALLCKVTITTNNKDAPYSRISAIQLIYNQWDSFQANKIQGRLQETMKYGGWLSTSWPTGRLFSKFHACGTEDKIGKGIPEERVTRAESSTENLQERRSELQDCQFIH